MRVEMFLPLCNRKQTIRRIIKQKLVQVVEMKDTQTPTTTTTAASSDEIETPSMKRIILNKTCRFVWKHSYTISLAFVMILTLHEIYNIAMIPIQYYNSVNEVDLNVKRASRSSETSLSGTISSTSSANSNSNSISSYPGSASIAIGTSSDKSSLSSNQIPSSSSNANSINSVYNTNPGSTSSATANKASTIPPKGYWNNAVSFLSQNEKQSNSISTKTTPATYTTSIKTPQKSRTTTNTTQTSNSISTTKHKNIILPPSFGNYADLTAPFDKTTDTIFFWKVHLSGATIAERIFGKCYNLIQSSEYYTATHGNKTAQQLQIVTIQNEYYYNVDLTTLEGMNHAKQLGLFSMQMNNIEKLDVLYSPLIHELGESIFNPRHRGRCITILRHPIERAIGLFLYLQTQQGKQDSLFHPSLETMSLEEYSVSASVENNWLTRFLVHKRGGRLGMEDVELAKEILGRKCIVGFMHQLHDSLKRFEYYFGLSHNKVALQKDTCEIDILSDGDTRHFNPLIQEDSKAYKSLAMHNQYDMILYEYALELYQEQSMTLFKDLYANE